LGDVTDGPGPIGKLSKVMLGFSIGYAVSTDAWVCLTKPESVIHREEGAAEEKKRAEEAKNA